VVQCLDYCTHRLKSRLHIVFGDLCTLGALNDTLDPFSIDGKNAARHSTQIVDEELGYIVLVEYLIQLFNIELLDLSANGVDGLHGFLWCYFDFLY
jgi:hypothetical protein